MLDGVVAFDHPSLAGAGLAAIETLASPASSAVSSGSAREHGTQIASVIFGRHPGPVRGVAPHCRGLIVPIYKDVVDGSPVPCSQLDLARALLQALQAGAMSSTSAAASFRLPARLIRSWQMPSRPVLPAEC